MGFKFKRVSFTGGSSTWGNTTRARAEAVVSGIAQALIDMGIGWGLDSERSASTTDFCEVPFMDSGGETMPGLFLQNIVSEDRLFIAYIAARCDHGIDLPNGQLVPCGEVTNPCYTGLIMSMIPGASGEKFGNAFDAGFLPPSATRIYGACQGSGKTNMTAYARYNGSGLRYCWGVCATYHCVAVACGYSNDDSPAELRLCFACGKILEHLAHEENTSQSKYGVLQFTTSTGSANAEAGTWKKASVNLGDASVDFFGTENLTKEYSASVSTSAVKSAACIFKADGAAVGHTSTANVRVFAENYGQLAGGIMASSAGTRWVPFTVAVVSTNLPGDGIVPGDGMKGYLDTNLFRCARATRGQYFDNHNFVCANDYCLLIGWDSGNQEEL